MPDLAGDLLIRDTLTAIDSGVDTEWYLAARAAGATHPETIEITSRYSSCPEDYVALRQLGLSHAQVNELFATDIQRYTYTLAYAAGATHPEILEFTAITGTPLTLYVWCREAGATHTQALDVAEHTTPDNAAHVVISYAQARRNGLSHPLSCLTAQAENSL